MKRACGVGCAAPGPSAPVGVGLSSAGRDSVGEQGPLLGDASDPRAAMAVTRRRTRSHEESGPAVSVRRSAGQHAQDLEEHHDEDADDEEKADL